jgi:hypothetical protein
MEGQMDEPIAEGFGVFVHDGNKAFGAVRQVLKGRKELVVYVENAGDFTLPFSAIKLFTTRRSCSTAASSPSLSARRSTMRMRARIRASESSCSLQGSGQYRRE